MKQEQEPTSTILSAAIVSAALVIGLLAGLSLGNMAHEFFTTSSRENMALPQQQ